MLTKLQKAYHQIINLYQELRYGKKIRFLHIGKTGGSFIRDTIKQIDTHHKVRFLEHKDSQLKDNNNKYIFFVRDPISRFISGFWSRYRKGKPKYNIEWTEDEEKAFKTFKTPNELAEALYSIKPNIRKEANDAMNAISHLRMDLSFYLKDIENINNCINNIFYVGQLENINNDLNNLILKLGYSTKTLKEEGDDSISQHKTPAKYLERSEISIIGKKNIQRFYKNDYKIINFLQSKNIIQ